MNAKGFPIVKLVLIKKGLYDGHDLKASNLLIFRFSVAREPPKLVVKFWASNLQLGSNYIDSTSPSLLLDYPLWPATNMFAPETRAIPCAHFKIWKIIKYRETCESRTWCIASNSLAEVDMKDTKSSTSPNFPLAHCWLGFESQIIYRTRISHM